MQLQIKRYQLVPHWTEFESCGEKYRFWAFVLGMSFPGYHIGLNTLITSVIGSNSIDTLLAYSILLGSMFMAIVKTPRSQWKKYFQTPAFIIVACYIILTISSWLNPETSLVLKHIKTTFLQTACWGVLAANLIDRTTLYQRALKLIGYIVFWFLVYEPFAPRSTLFVEVNNSWGTSGYLTWGYRMLIAVILLLYTATNYQVPFDECRRVYHFSELEDSRCVYDAFFESKRMNDFHEIKAMDVTVDLYGSKIASKTRYWLSRKILNYAVVSSYGCSMRPHEANIVYNIPGEDFFLYDTSIEEKNWHKFNAKRKAVFNHRYILLKDYLPIFETFVDTISIGIKKRLKHGERK